MAAAVLKCKTLTERSWHVCITQVRYRKHIKVRNPPEPHFDRKCMLEVCKPIYKKEELSDWERCARRPQLLQERPIHPYHQLLAKKLKEEWKMARMICFFHCNPIKEEEKKSVRNMLFKKDLHLRHYPTDVITLGLKGTPTETALHLWDPHSALVYSTEPNVATLLKLSKKMPQYILLAGIVDNYFLSREDLQQYSNLPSLDIMRSQLCNTLMSAVAQTTNALSYHQSELSNILQQYVKQKSE